MADIAEWSEGVITPGVNERISGKHNNCQDVCDMPCVHEACADDEYT